MSADPVEGERRYVPYVCANGHEFAVAFDPREWQVKCAACGTITVAAKPIPDLMPASPPSADTELERLREALREVENWDAHAAKRHGGMGVREFARAALHSQSEENR